jgi:hypothetical protein
MTALSGSQQCYAKGSYGSRTTSRYLSLSFRCPSWLAAWAGCPNTVHIFFILFSVGWGHPFLVLLWGVTKPKFPHLLFELLLDFDDISVGRAQGRDVQKFHFGLDVSMKSTMILEQQMSLWIFDTQLGAQGMEDICELWHCLVSFLPQCGPFGIQVITTSDRVVLFLNNIPEGFPSGRDYK